MYGKGLKVLLGAIGILIVVIGAYFYVKTMKGTITRLRGQLGDSQVEIANLKLESTRYKNAVEVQNKSIKVLEASEKLSLAKLRKWKEQKPEIRYKVIQNIEEMKSDDCKDIKNTIDSIRSIDFRSL